ncbi:MAG: EamA family transporter [Anaerolineales bacterium]|nr:EamA family transporter [Anaerolineales bacterium]
MLSIIFSLGAALAWGAADFTGGLASRRTGAYRAALYGEFFGLVFIVAAAFVIRQPLPDWSVLVLAAAAGAIGTTGLLTLFRSVIHGKMSIAMPVSALLAAALPVLVGSLTEGFPGAITFLGFILALFAIWLISQEDGKDSRILARLTDLRLPLLAGIGFGSFFILMDIAAREATLWPMLASRTGGTVIVAIFMSFRRDSWRLPRDVWPVLVLNGFLDVGGTAFYVLASQAGRLDVAAVISSLFPGSTVILAALILNERVSRMQAIGILLALTAIALLTI